MKTQLIKLRSYEQWDMNRKQRNERGWEGEREGGWVSAVYDENEINLITQKPIHQLTLVLSLVLVSSEFPRFLFYQTNNTSHFSESK